MWMAYKEEFPAYDLRSAVQEVYGRFRDFAFEADHKAVYGIEYFP